MKNSQSQPETLGQESSAIIGASKVLWWQLQLNRSGNYVLQIITEKGSRRFKLVKNSEHVTCCEIPINNKNRQLIILRAN